MEMSSPIPIPWLQELGMEDSMFPREYWEMHNYGGITLDDTTTMLGFDEDFNHFHHHRHQVFSSSIESNSNSNATVAATATARPRKQRRPKKAAANTAHFPVILNFGSSSMTDDVINERHEESTCPLKKPQLQSEEEEQEIVYRHQTPAKKTATRSSREHILAERKRREKITQRFIALSALVPGLKKMDKSSVLGDAIKYVKQLQEKIKNFEEEKAREGVESVVLVKKSQIILEDDTNSSSCNNEEGPTNQGNGQLPKIEASVSNTSVLLKIQCENKESVILKIIAAIEKFHLLITSLNAMPFGDRILDITIVAQMEKEIDVRPQNLVRDLSSVFRGL